VVLEDTAGYWKDMPEKIEAAVYDGLSEADMDRLEAEPPELFPSPVEAIRWGMDQVDANGQPVFKDEAHAQNAYDKVKWERQPQSARDMRNVWFDFMVSPDAKIGNAPSQRTGLTLTELSDTVGEKFSDVNVSLLIYRDATHGREPSFDAVRTIPQVQEAPLAVIFANTIVLYFPVTEM
jgi:hypothetical protein